MENLFLSADKFEGRLNMNIFKNIEKSITEDELSLRYPEGKFLTFEKSNIDAFIRNTYESIGGEIKKGGFNDTEDVRDLLTKAESDLAKLKPVLVRANEEVRTVYVLQKGEEDLLKKGGQDELQKGAISEAFYYADIKFTKTGEEIKSKILDIKDKLEDEASDIVQDIIACAENLTMRPNKEVSIYETNKKCPYKVFDWNQTYYDTFDNSSIAEGIDCCSSVEVAKQNSEYNNKVYRWMEVEREIEQIELYERNLKDKTGYDLTARQMIALGF